MVRFQSTAMLKPAGKGRWGVVGWLSHPPCFPLGWAPSKDHMRGLPQGGFFWAILGTLDRVTELHRGVPLLDCFSVTVHHHCHLYN